jgi:pSer/pThr/pTyr-binding forkhead associated (FHA) protein
MRGLRRLFDAAYRKARAAEAAGQYREAARLYAEAGAMDQAAEALVFLAHRAPTSRERAQAYEDALRWIPEGTPRRAEVEIALGLARLEEARVRGPGTPDERRVLAEAAARLEHHGREGDAAAVYEILGRVDDVARCLEAAGEIERLEALLEARAARDAADRAVRAAVQSYELADRMGARLDARDALRRGLSVAPDDPGLGDLLQRLEARLCRGHRVELRVDGASVVLVGRLPAVLGRDADLTVRGPTVSRLHARIERVVGGEGAAGARYAVRDAGSRNGTFVRGVPLGGALPLHGPMEVGLGDAVTVAVEPAGAALRIEVRRGPDRGRVFIVGDEALPVPGARAEVHFPSGHPTLAAAPGARCTLRGVSCAAPIVLARGDVVEVDGVPIEVVA